MSCRSATRPGLKTTGEITPNTCQANAAPLAGSWMLLFPATYLIHIAEEYWGGLPARSAELTGLAISEEAFLAANAFFWILMIAAGLATVRRSSRAPLIVALATIVTINGTLHLGGSLLTASYSPGLVSGLLLWLPLGLSALARGSRVLPRKVFRAGILVGIVAHVFVPLVGLAFILALDGG